MIKYYILLDKDCTTDDKSFKFKLWTVEEISGTQIYQGRYGYDSKLEQITWSDPENEEDATTSIDIDSLKEAITLAHIREVVLKTPVDFHTHADDYYLKTYGSYLRIAGLTRAMEFNLNITAQMKRVESALKWLENNTDFFTAPASSRFHENYAQGLVEHSLKVIVKSLELMKLPTFNNCNLKLGSVMLIALVHDWCKCGLYEGYMKNVKDDTTGRWSQVQSYRRTDRRPYPLGHGAASMYLAQRWFGVTFDEASAIRFHMSAWQGVNGEEDELEQCNETIPYVHLVQFADQLAITDYAFRN